MLVQNRGYQRGFSLIEMVMVLLILSILAVSAGARWPGSGLTLQAAADQLAQGVRLAQAHAMGTGTSAAILRISPDTYQIQDKDGIPIETTTLRDITITPFSVSFNNLGDPQTGTTDTTITLSTTDEQRPLQITAITGAVVFP